VANDSLFSVQYAYARCWSLVQLGCREKLIQLQEEGDNLFLLSPNPIPWLNCEKLRFHHPNELSLLSQLIQVVDDLEFPANNSFVNWGKTALTLSQCFERFWASCRIWGDVESLELAQARLGLILATSFVLKLLLEKKLGISTPNQL
jgi:arginyl-tRNA synthetase